MSKKRPVISKPITAEMVREAEEELGLREIIDAGLRVLFENAVPKIIAKAVEEETDASFLKSNEIKPLKTATKRGTYEP